MKEKVIIIVDDQMVQHEIDENSIYFLSHPCTNGGLNEVDNRSKEQKIYDKILEINPKAKIIRPLTIIPEKYDYDEAMRVCYSILGVSSYVIFSPGWQHSKGCKLEHKYCIENDIKRFYIFEEDISAIK